MFQRLPVARCGRVSNVEIVLGEKRNASKAYWRSGALIGVQKSNKSGNLFRTKSENIENRAGGEGAVVDVKTA